MVEAAALALAVEVELEREAGLEIVKQAVEAKISQFHPFRSLVMNEQAERLAMRPLTETEKTTIIEKTGMKAKMLENAMIDENGVVHIRCDNMDLAGKTHEKTDVPYVRKEVEINGIKLEVVSPEFESLFDTYLPDDKIPAGYEAHKTECMESLKNEIAKNPELRNRFNADELQMIEKGKIPRGYTWHHDAEYGKMQLVKTSVHANSGHTGGMAIWGGGH